MSPTWQLLLMQLLLIVLLKEVQGDCCKPLYGAVCDDDTLGTPCCGYESCNIFCCNCTCRVRKWNKWPTDHHNHFHVKLRNRRKHSRKKKPKHRDYVKQFSAC